MSVAPDIQKIAEVVAQAAADKLATDIVAFDVSETLAITNVFVVATANNERQVGAVIDNIEEQVRKELGLKPVRKEGDKNSNWVLLDYFDVVVHVQLPEARSLYSLERLWKDAPQVALEVEQQA